MSDEEARLRVLQSTDLLDTDPEPAFDRLTRLASQLLRAPVALVSLVDADRQFFKSARGLAEPWASRRQTPLTHSFCQYATRDRKSLIVSDAREHSVLRDNLAVRDLSVIAYAGIPLFVDGEAVGVFCVVDDKPRAWTDDEVELLDNLAKSVISEIELRMSLRAERARREELERHRSLMDALVESLGDAVLAVDTSRTFLVANAAARRIFADAERGKALPADWSGLHGSRRPDGSPLPSNEGALARALHGHETDGLTFTLQKPGAAEPVWVEATGRPVRTADGRVLAGIAVYRNVTERKRQADFYATLARSIPRAAVALFDHELRCLALDGGMPRADGVPVEQMVGRTMRELAGPEGDARFDAIEAMYERTLAGEGSQADFPSGSRVLELHSAPVRDELGRVVAGLVLAMDKTAERKAEAALRRSEQVHRAIVEHVPNAAIFVVDHELRYIAAEGPLVEEVLRRTHLSRLVGRTVAEVASEDNRSGIVALASAALRGERPSAEMRRDNRFFDIHAVPIYDGTQISHGLLFVYDVTERRREAEDLLRMRSLLETVLANITDGVALFDADGRLAFANQAFASMADLSMAELQGLGRQGFLAHLATMLESPESIGDWEGRSLALDIVFRRPRRRVVRRSRSSVGDRFLITWRDVTADRDLERERERQLLVDPLTGIPNRRAAEVALRNERERMKRTGLRFSVAVFDVDHFKQVNDAFGHSTGDEVLRRVAATLTSEARITDTIARWGGEEFLAVLPGAGEGANAYCERARREVEKLRASQVNRVTVSAGVAEVGLQESVADAIARADAALYAAKREGRNRVKMA